MMLGSFDWDLAVGHELKDPGSEPEQGYEFCMELLSCWLERARGYGGLVTPM